MTTECFAALSAALLIFPGVVFETAFDEQRSSLLAILVNDFRLFSERGNINEQYLFAIFAILRAVLVVYREAEIRHRHLTGQIA